MVTYNKAGVTLKEPGENVAASMIRNSRLLEVLMDSALKIDIDEEMVCGIEHHMNKQFTDALCIMLKCPSKVLEVGIFQWVNVVKHLEEKKSKRRYTIQI